MRRKLPVGTRVKFNLAQGLDVGVARIIDVDIEGEGKNKERYYKLEVLEGSNAEIHRNDKGELWVNDWEVKPVR
jgi:hypothetical protein